MDRRVDKLLEATHPEAGPKVVHNSPRVASKTSAPNLFDLDPCKEPERPIRIELDLDQLEDAVE